MQERDRVIDVAEKVAAAIGRRDVAAIGELLSPDFVHRTHGGAGADRALFLAGIEQIPGEIVFVRLEQLVVDIAASWALVTGLQHAQVRVDGQVVDDRRGFVDWFVKQGNAWRIQAAVDLPAPSTG
jgi:hypothetical protein